MFFILFTMSMHVASKIWGDISQGDVCDENGRYI